MAHFGFGEINPFIFSRFFIEKPRAQFYLVLKHIFQIDTYLFIEIRRWSNFKLSSKNFEVFFILQYDSITYISISHFLVGNGENQFVSKIFNFGTYFLQTIEDFLKRKTAATFLDRNWEFWPQCFPTISSLLKGPQHHSVHRLVRDYKQDSPLAYSVVGDTDRTLYFSLGRIIFFEVFKKKTVQF